MARRLRRTAFSSISKSARYSCAVFDGAGEVVAMGDHMPVHLGSMPMSVRAAVETLTLNGGDVAILNEPLLWRHALAGHHTGRSGFSAARASAHGSRHFMWRRARTMPMSGGTYAGSMGICREIYQEASAFLPSS